MSIGRRRASSKHSTTRPDLPFKCSLRLAPTHTFTDDADPLFLTTIKPIQSHLRHLIPRDQRLWLLQDQGPFIYQLIQRPGFLLRSGSSIPMLSLASPLTLSSIYLVSASDLCCVESVKAHKDAVNTIMVSEDGTISGFADKWIQVWAKPFSMPLSIWEKFFLCFFFLRK